MNRLEIDQGLSEIDPWYQALFEGNPQPVYIYDAENLMFLAVNEATIAHYGFSKDEFLSMTTKAIRPVEDIPALLEEIQALKIRRHTGFQTSRVRKHRLKDGRIIFVETSKELLAFNGREAICVLVNDVTERVLAEQKIQHLAYFDDLTGLPNRTQLRNDLRDAIGHAQQTSTSFALLAVELIQFRDINYTVGHLLGDELLKQVGPRIRQAVGENAAIARIGNVQFGVLLKANPGKAIRQTEQLLKALGESFSAGGINYALGAHVGIAFYPAHGTDPDELLRHADIARYQARKVGRDYSIYDAAQDPYNPRRLALLSDFRKAIMTDQLRLYCQPKADLRTEAITGAEVLIRWQHPDYGLLMPDQFIPLIEPTELVQPLIQWVLEAALQQCYEWRQKSLIMPLAINLSTRNLLDPHLPETVNALIQTWGADTTWIGLEITESSIMSDPAAALRVLNELHQMGLTLFIDDFGTGYSSLSYLMKLPLDVIKIDHAFTMNMIEDKDAAVIVKSTIEMAHNMGMKVIAEGAASKEIWEALKRLDCDEGQGHYISPPLLTRDFSAWLEHSPWALPANA